jgi:hypothetical protein
MESSVGRGSAAKEQSMNPYLSHALMALLLTAPALAAAEHAEPVTHDEMHQARGDHEAFQPQAGHDDAAPPSVRWASDAPLREGMRRVRATTQALAHAAHGHLDAGQVQGISAELEGAVRAMFANCRLAPGPDAALHPLLARVLQVSTSLAGGGFDAAALAELQAVLARYPELFEDADWNLDQDDPA